MAAAIGLTIQAYEDMTPWELSVYAEAFAERQRQTAYLQGLVIRAMIGTAFSGKRAPSFTDMFGKPAHIDEPMGDDALFQAMLTAHRALGGETILTDKEVG